MVWYWPHVYWTFFPNAKYLSHTLSRKQSFEITKKMNMNLINQVNHITHSLARYHLFIGFYKMQFWLRQINSTRYFCIQFFSSPQSSIKNTYRPKYLIFTFVWFKGGSKVKSAVIFGGMVMITFLALIVTPFLNWTMGRSLVWSILVATWLSKTRWGPIFETKIKWKNLKFLSSSWQLFSIYGFPGFLPKSSDCPRSGSHTTADFIT